MAARKTATKKAPTSTTTRKTTAAKAVAAKKAAAPAKKTAAPAKKTATPAKKAARPAAKKSAAREVAKVSPLRGMAVGDYISAKLSGWQAELTARLVAITMKAAPEASAAIKWSQPVFESNGPFAFIKPAKAHVSYGFWRGAEMSDPKKLLTVSGSRMGHLKLTGPGSLDEAELTRMVKEAVRLNREKGSPTLRGG